MEVESAGVSGPGGAVRPLLHRHLCVEGEWTTSNLLQLESRPSCSSNGQPINFLEETLPIYVSCICSHLTMLGQAPQRRSISTYDGTCPPAPKYSTTWNVHDVLTYLSSLPNNAELSFQMLIRKLAMLMGLSNTDRCSALDLNLIMVMVL